VTYEGLTTELLKRIPELRLRYRQLLGQWGGDQPGQHIVFEDVVVPVVFEQLRFRKAKPLLRRIFDLLEEMAAHPDPDVRDVVGQAVGESFWEHDDLLAQAKRFMGPRTAEVIDTAWSVRFRTR
jgi:hypothetical protein